MESDMLGTVWYANILLSITLKYKSYVPSQILLFTFSFLCLGQHFTYTKSVLYFHIWMKYYVCFKAWGLVFWAATKMQPRSEIVTEVNLDQGEEDMGGGQGENVPLLSRFLMVYFELKFLLSILLEKSKIQSELWLLMSPLWFFIVTGIATHISLPHFSFSLTFTVLGFHWYLSNKVLVLSRTAKGLTLLVS